MTNAIIPANVLMSLVILAYPLMVTQPHLQVVALLAQLINLSLKLYN